MFWLAIAPHADISTSMWDEKFENSLSRRERQVIEIVMRLCEVSAREIEEELSDAPTYSAVRSILRLLVEKKLLVKKRVGGRDWFSLPVNASKARMNALQSLVRRFFENSASDAALALLGQKNVKLSKVEADKLMKLVEEARK